MSRRLFEQGTDVTPSLTMRVASGKAGSATQNSTWQTILTWLETALPFLNKNNNLSDITNDATARTNLNVYSQDEEDAAHLLKADKANVLQLDNTTPFTPDTDYEPATKLYVDQSGRKLTRSGNTDVTLGSHITDFVYSITQRGNIVLISGYFQTDSYDTGQNWAELAIISNPVVSVPPAGSVWFGSTGATYGGVQAFRTIPSGTGINLQWTGGTSAGEKYFFNVTYIL